MTKKISMDDLYALVKNGLPKGELVLDVREPEEFTEGHVAGAMNMPHEDILNHAAEKASQLKGYSKIYVHCLGGTRAGKATAALEGAGLKGVVHVADSGMRNWIAAGYPVVK